MSIKSKQSNPARGVCAAVARELGLSHEHVRQVLRGNRESSRVSKALAVELRKRNRQLGRRAA